MSKIYVQIGAEKGGDNFLEIVKRESPDKVILVEPNINVLKDLHKSYEGIENVSIINKAIFYESGKIVDLYIPAKDGVYGNKGENGITYSTGHFSLLPMNDWGEKSNMVKISAETININDLFDSFNISEIQYLSIDTEGFDSEILQMIDFSKYKIQKIRYEKWGFKTDVFTKFNSEISHRLGLEGMKISQEVLQKNGYKILDDSLIEGDNIIAELQS